MKIPFDVVRPALISFAALSLLCGIAYTGTITAVAQSFFRHEANGSVISVKSNDGSVRDYGSALLAQEFTGPEYLVGRLMGVTNLSPSSVKEAELIKSRVAGWQSLDPGNNAPIPADLVTASGSGVDPYISPDAAEYQVHRLALVRGVSENDIRSVIATFTNGRFLGVFGEPAVNVLKVNLALDKLL